MVPHLTVDAFLLKQTYDKLVSESLFQCENDACSLGPESMEIPIPKSVIGSGQGSPRDISNFLDILVERYFRQLRNTQNACRKHDGSSVFAALQDLPAASGDGVVIDRLETNKFYFRRFSITGPSKSLIFRLPNHWEHYIVELKLYPTHARTKGAPERICHGNHARHGRDSPIPGKLEPAGQVEADLGQPPSNIRSEVFCLHLPVCHGLVPRRQRSLGLRQADLRTTAMSGVRQSTVRALSSWILLISHLASIVLSPFLLIDFSDAMDVILIMCPLTGAFVLIVVQHYAEAFEADRGPQALVDPNAALLTVFLCVVLGLSVIGVQVALLVGTNTGHRYAQAVGRHDRHGDRRVHRNPHQATVRDAIRCEAAPAESKLMRPVLDMRRSTVIELRGAPQVFIPHSPRYD